MVYRVEAIMGYTIYNYNGHKQSTIIDTKKTGGDDQAQPTDLKSSTGHRLIDQLLERSSALVDEILEN